MIHVEKLKQNDLSSIEFIVGNLIEEPNLEDYSEHLLGLLKNDNTYLYAAIHEEVIIGYALAYKFPSLYSADQMAYLYDIDVVVEHQRKGAGRMLLEALMDELKDEGVYELWLGTEVHNKAGQALFRAAGGIPSEKTFNDFTFILSPD